MTIMAGGPSPYGNPFQSSPYNQQGGGFGGMFPSPYGGGFGRGFGRQQYNPYGGGFGGGFGGGYMAPFPPRRPSPYFNPYYMDSLRGGGMGQVMPTNIPFRDPGYGSPMLTQNLIQSLGGPQSSFRNTYRPYSTLGMLDRFRGGNMGSPYPMPYPMPSPGGKGGRMTGMPGKGGQVPPDQGMPQPDIGTNLPPQSDTGTTPADTMTDLQRNILAEQGFTEQEARNAFDAIIQNQEETLDPRFRDLIGTGYYRRIGEAFGLKDAAGNPVTLGGATAVQGIDYPGQIITRAPSEEQLAQFQQNIPQATPERTEIIDPAEGQPRTDGGYDSSGINPYGMYDIPEERATASPYTTLDLKNINWDNVINEYPGVQEALSQSTGFNPQNMLGGRINKPFYDDETQIYNPSNNTSRSLLRGIGGLYGIGGGMIPDFSGMLQRVTQ